MKKRIFYIDGENLFHRITDILIEQKHIRTRRELVRFDFRYFLGEIIHAKLNPKDEIYYYGTKLKLAKANSTLKKQTQAMLIHKRTWGQALANQKITFISAGHLKIRQTKPCIKCSHEGDVFQEKGVDVRLAVDLVKNAFEKNNTTSYIISSDTDLLPAIHAAKDKKMELHYVCTSTDLNWAIYKACGKALTFSEEAVVEAYKRAQKK